MTRTPVAVTTGQATSHTTGRATADSFGGTTTARGSATTNTTGSAMTIRGPEGKTEVLPPNTTEFAIDPEKRKEMRFGGVRVKLIEFDDLGIKYELVRVEEAGSGQ